MISINVLPDDVLLDIFDFYVEPRGIRASFQPAKKAVEAWQSLVHVCRQWRSVVFGSPRRLNLRLVCSSWTPVRDTIDIWPGLRLIIDANSSYLHSGGVDQKGLDNIVAALEHKDRVDEIRVSSHDDPEMDKVLAAMQVPFPELIIMRIERWSSAEMATVLPDSFLGGSAPRLQSLELHRIPFPGLPKLLLSATRLVYLYLFDIPHSGYFSPEAMVTALSSLTNLKSLYLRFLSPQSHPDRENRSPPLLARFVLPALTILVIKGDSEYIDDLLASIDAPRLNELNITFFNQILFDAPQFIQFISRTQGLKSPEKAHVTFDDDIASVRLTSGAGYLMVEVRCIELDWLVSSMEQVCTWCLPPLFTLEDLYIKAQGPKSNEQDNIENALWLELLQPFTAVKNLYLSKKFAPHIVPALQELVGGRTTEVLPTLQNIFLEGLEPSGPVREGIEQFVGARLGSIAVNLWE